MKIWDYIETIEVCKSSWSVLEFGHTYNYIPNDSGKLHEANRNYKCPVS